MNIGIPELIGLAVIVLIVIGFNYAFLPRVWYSIARAIGKGFRDGMNDKNP
jgi:Sec-independent protein translocase protein TatA